MPVEEVLRRKEESYFNFLPNLKAVPEVLEHIHASYGRIPLAVVSGSRRDSVTASLNSLGLLEKFELLVCAGDYRRGKPIQSLFCSLPHDWESNPRLVWSSKIRTWALSLQSPPAGQACGFLRLGRGTRACRSKSAVNGDHEFQDWQCGLSNILHWGPALIRSVFSNFYHK